MANIARDGAPKRFQAAFTPRDTMKDMTMLSAGPANPGAGPDASAANPLEAEARGKLLKKQPGAVGAAWDMTDGDGDGVDPTIGGDVLKEGKLTGHL
jgi:hypothetical protein